MKENQKKQKRQKHSTQKQHHIDAELCLFPFFGATTLPILSPGAFAGAGGFLSPGAGAGAGAILSPGAGAFAGSSFGPGINVPINIGRIGGFGPGGLGPGYGGGGLGAPYGVGPMMMRRFY